MNNNNDIALSNLFVSVRIPGQYSKRIDDIDFEFRKDIFKAHFSGREIRFSGKFTIDEFIKRLGPGNPMVTPERMVDFYFDYTRIFEVERIRLNVTMAVEKMCYLGINKNRTVEQETEYIRLQSIIPNLQSELMRVLRRLNGKQDPQTEIKTNFGRSAAATTLSHKVAGGMR